MTRTLVQINRIDIISKGDPSVGIFSQSWSIEQPIYVEMEDLETFKEKLEEAWEYVADDAEFNYEYVI